MRILVVEDEPDLLSGIVRALRAAGYFVDTAGDGEEGLFKAASVDYDVVLLDVMLLRLARLDSGAHPLGRVRFDLAGRAADGVELVAPLAARRGIAVKADLEAAECAGDPEQIDQVVANLLANAIEHNVENGEIRISTRAASGQAILTVADRGPGIADAHLPHVFERFYRADASRSRASGGVGLGLAIARAIVEAHGGSIQVASEPGRGAVFTVTLPSGP